MPDTPPPLVNAANAANCAKVAPKAVLRIGPEYVEATFDPEAINEASVSAAKAFACCMSGFTGLGKTRETSEDTGCIDTGIDCDGTAEEVDCDVPVAKIPGKLTISDLLAQIPFTPGLGKVADWLDKKVSCAEQNTFYICYANGAKQVIPCGFFSSDQPQQFTEGGTSALTDIAISFCGSHAPFYVS